MQLRAYRESDFDTVHAIINDAAARYRGVIPDDCWHEPYMGREELAAEIADGVRFTLAGAGDELAGVLGLQDRGAVMLIRHAYVHSSCQRRGIGTALLADALARSDRPCLIGTWAAATWAIDFYRQHGFRVIDGASKDALLARYWRVPARQMATSIVLAPADFDPAAQS